MHITRSKNSLCSLRAGKGGDLMEENNSSTSSDSSGSKKGLIIAAVAVIVILAIAAGGFAFMNMNKKSESTNTTAVESADTQAEATPEAMQEEAASTNAYKDGTYEATGTYSYHSGTESVKVSVTLENGKVEDVTVVSLAKAPTSKQMQADFIAHYKSMVVGKNIDDVKLSKVSGSSLTSGGFNAAIEDIKSQAKG
jgi:uncharacterized protein with FMN-binding domain